MHSYGKTGNQLGQLAQELDELVNYMHMPNASQGGSNLPIVFTEHNTRTSSDFGAVPTTLDTPSEASRFAAQLLFLGLNGADAYSFKLSATPSSRGGVAKTGLFWGDNEFPYSYGAPTAAAEAMRLLNAAMVGRKVIETVSLFPPSTPDQFPGVSFRPALSLRDGNRKRSLIFINDGVPATLPAPNVALTINISSWGLPAGTLCAPPAARSQGAHACAQRARLHSPRSLSSGPHHLTLTPLYAPSRSLSPLYPLLPRSAHFDGWARPSRRGVPTLYSARKRRRQHQRPGLQARRGPPGADDRMS